MMDRMYVGGEWTDSSTREEIRNPFSGEVVGEVPWASAVQVEQALDAAHRGASAMARTTAYQRSQMLLQAASLLESRAESIARLISAEEGKPIYEARIEVGRAPDLMRVAAFEGAHLRGESLPLDAAVNGAGRLGFTLHSPCGIVVAITPFNFPLLLVIHKVAPALASGNAVVLKPAHQTPMTALALVDILLEAGLPPLAIQVLTGPGSTIGPLLCSDARVRKITFTGSTQVGEQITQVAGIKRLSLELGSNCPLVVLPDSDAATVSESVAASGYLNAGQVCISTQRVLVHRRAYEDFLDALTTSVNSIVVGDPFDEETRLSAMISDGEAKRVMTWIGDAVQSGARVLTGNERSGAVVAPTIVADVRPDMRISCEELFGPATAITPISDVDEAIAIVNESDYGLAAGIYTADVDVAMRFAREAAVGNVNINGTPTWRADFMPYGGMKKSGIGKEGPRYAVGEMTESKTVIIHSRT